MREVIGMEQRVWNDGVEGGWERGLEGTRVGGGREERRVRGRDGSKGEMDMRFVVACI